MCTNPKNILSASDIFNSDHFCEDGKMKTVKKTYLCEYFIQAITMKETLKTITGKKYDIEKNGVAGWKVVISR